MQLILLVTSFIFGIVATLVLIETFVRHRYTARVERETVWNYLRSTPAWVHEQNITNAEIIRTLSVKDVLRLRSYGNTVVVSIVGSPHDPFIMVQLPGDREVKCKALKASQLFQEILSRTPITSSDAQEILPEFVRERSAQRYEM